MTSKGLKNQIFLFDVNMQEIIYSKDIMACGRHTVTPLETSSTSSSSTYELSFKIIYILWLNEEIEHVS